MEAAYASVQRIEIALSCISLAIGATVVDFLVIRALDGPYGLLTAAALFKRRRQSAAPAPPR